MPRLRLTALVSLAMLAFAGNSLLCRLALKHTGIDAATFTAVRLISGALMLWLVVRFRRVELSTAGNPAAAAAGSGSGGGNWLSALALFVYAAGFSFAYVSMPAATGALLLFGAVQATMIGFGVWRGERLRGLQWAGLALAVAGLVLLMLPGLAAPSLPGAASMVAAGVAWGIYSLRGKKTPTGSSGPDGHNPPAADPTRVTANNFLRTVPMAVLLGLVMVRQLAPDPAGMGLAVVSGALASGLGYAVWYRALPALKATQAATVQLSVPVIAALGGVALLGEALTGPMLLAAGAILGGIALVILEKK